MRGFLFLLAVGGIVGAGLGGVIGHEIGHARCHEPEDAILRCLGPDTTGAGIGALVDLFLGVALVVVIKFLREPWE